jgi:hypothetical protein
MFQYTLNACNQYEYYQVTNDNVLYNRSYAVSVMMITIGSLTKRKNQFEEKHINQEMLLDLT